MWEVWEMKIPATVVVGLLTLCLLSGQCRIAFGQAGLSVSAETFVGWQDGRQTFTASSDGPYPGALFRYVQLRIPNRGGLWLGEGIKAGIGCDLKLFLQGWYLFPNNIDGTILLDPGATPRLIPADINAHTDWWYVDGFGTYRLNGAFSAVLGVRYDHHNFYTNDQQILDLLFGPVAGHYHLPLNDALRLDLNVLTTTPYFGCQLGDSEGITLRVIYSPWSSINVESTLSQNDGIFRPQNWLGGRSTLSKKTFAELFVQYSARVAPSLQAAIFAKGTLLEGSTKTSVSETLVHGAAGYDVSYHSVGWMGGINANLEFELPDFRLPW
jgi:hypothetical protein